MSTVGRTNQVLYFARLSLEKAAQASAPQDKRMFEEQALFHLYTCIISFHAELLNQYNLPEFEQLTELYGREQLPSELYELSLLYKESGSWLGTITGQYRRLFSQGLGKSVNTGLIVSQSDYSSLFHNCLIELEKTIQRMREHYQEN